MTRIAGEGGLACHCLPFIALIEGSLVRASQRLFTRPGKKGTRDGERKRGDRRGGEEERGEKRGGRKGLGKGGEGGEEGEGRGRYRRCYGVTSLCSYLSGITWCHVSFKTGCEGMD